MKVRSLIFGAALALAPAALPQQGPAGSKMLIVDDLNDDGRRLRHELLLRDGEQPETKVAEDFEFATGQTVRVKLRPAADGDLYVLYHENGETQSFMPNPALFGGDTKVWRGRDAVLPLQLTGEPGKFDLIAVLVDKDAPPESREKLFSAGRIDADSVVRWAGLEAGGKGAVLAPEAGGEISPSAGVTIVRITINHAR